MSIVQDAALQALENLLPGTSYFRGTTGKLTHISKLLTLSALVSAPHQDRCHALLSTLSVLQRHKHSRMSSTPAGCVSQAYCWPCMFARPQGLTSAAVIAALHSSRQASDCSRSSCCARSRRPADVWEATCCQVTDALQLRPSAPQQHSVALRANAKLVAVPRCTRSGVSISGSLCACPRNNVPRQP